MVSSWRNLPEYAPVKVAIPMLHVEQSFHKEYFVGSYLFEKDKKTIDHVLDRHREYLIKDTTYAARTWAESNLPAGTKWMLSSPVLAEEHVNHDDPRFSFTRHALGMYDYRIRATVGVMVMRLRHVSVEYLLNEQRSGRLGELSSNNYLSYEEWLPDFLDRAPVFLKKDNP